MRGGTSKAVFLWAHDLPTELSARDAVIAAVFGSPDGRQIDGLGGADPLTSKVAIISREAPHGSHLTYTFGQVGIESGIVDYESLCGNVTAAVGHFAVGERLVDSEDGIATVAIFNSNLRRVLHVEVPVSGGAPIDSGDFTVSGVPGTGARIRVDLAATAGARTGFVLPTGSRTDILACPGIGDVSMSLLDVGNPHVFVRASDFGLEGTESTESLGRDRSLMEALERVRAVAAARMAIVPRAEHAETQSPAIPLLALVGPPSDYVAEGSGTEVLSSSVDVVSRLIFMQKPHKAYAGTSTVCTGVAARLEGTVVAEMMPPSRAGTEEILIGHPRGVIATETIVSADEKTVKVSRATVDRTARRILDGTVYIR